MKIPPLCNTNPLSSHILSRALLKGRVAHDLLHDSLLLQSPRTTLPISKGDVDVLPAKNNNGALSANKLAPQGRVDKVADHIESDRLDGRGLRDLDLVGNHTREIKGDADLRALALEKDADLEPLVVRLDLLKVLVANDLPDDGGLPELPGALVAVGEGHVRVGPAEHDDGLVLLVQDLAAEVGVPDVVAEGELHFGDGLSDVGPRADRAAAGLPKVERLLGVVAKGDRYRLRGAVVAGVQGGGGGQEGGKDGCELHLDVWWLYKKRDGESGWETVR